MGCSLAEQGCFYLKQQSEFARHSFAYEFIAYLAWKFPNLTADEIDNMVEQAREHAEKAKKAATAFENGEHCEECIVFF